MDKNVKWFFYGHITLKHIWLTVFPSFQETTFFHRWMIIKSLSFKFDEVWVLEAGVSLMSRKYVIQANININNHVYLYVSDSLKQTDFQQSSLGS